MLFYGMDWIPEKAERNEIVFAKINPRDTLLGSALKAKQGKGILSFKAQPLLNPGSAKMFRAHPCGRRRNVLHSRVLQTSGLAAALPLP